MSGKRKHNTNMKQNKKNQLNLFWDTSEKFRNTLVEHCQIFSIFVYTFFSNSHYSHKSILFLTKYLCVCVCVCVFFFFCSKFMAVLLSYGSFSLFFSHSQSFQLNCHTRRVCFLCISLLIKIHFPRPNPCQIFHFRSLVNTIWLIISICSSFYLILFLL